MKSKLALTLVTLCTIAKAAGPPNIAWNPNAEPDIASYVLHIGTNSGSYQSTMTLAAPLTVVSSKLIPWFPGQTNYVVVTAVNAQGFESGLSNEISANIPANPKQLRLALESAPTPTGPWTEQDAITFSPTLAENRFYRGRINIQ